MSKNYYSAREASEKLSISRSTLYAYVSRGLIHSEEKAGKLRERVYLAADVERLLNRKKVRKRPDEAALGALDWGQPILESSVSQIQNGYLYYRGHEISAIVADYSLEETLALLWKQADLKLELLEQVLPLSHRESIQTLNQSLVHQHLSWFERTQILTPYLAALDLSALDLSPAGVLRSSQSLLFLFYLLAAGSLSLTNFSSGSLIGVFKELLPDEAQRELLRVLMLVCADHELNVSAFSARCVASARGTPHAGLSAGLASLSGSRHGGMTYRVESLFQSCEQATSVQQGLKIYLQQSSLLPGFGHKLYPEGDPRWHCLRDCLVRSFARHPELALILEIEALGSEYMGARPSLDFALVSAARVLAPKKFSALDWFALGRLPGWLAHIQEQYLQPELIRPRAKYS